MTIEVIPSILGGELGTQNYEYGLGPFLPWLKEKGSARQRGKRGYEEHGPMLIGNRIGAISRSRKDAMSQV